MSDGRVDRRRKNGSRLDGRALAMRVAQEVNGMQLARAFVVTRSAGIRLQVNKHDGVARVGYVVEPGAKVMVNVVAGHVKASWVVD